MLTSSTHKSEASNEPVKFELWKRIYGRVGKYWNALALSLLLVVVAAATQPALAVIMKPLLDDGFNGNKPEYIWTIPLAFVSLVFLRGIVGYFSSYLFAWVANNVLLGLRQDMFKRLVHLPDADFKRGDTGRLLNRFTVDAGNVTYLATDVIMVLVRESIAVLALIGVLLYMSWQLTLIVIVVLPVSALISRYFIRRLRRINRGTIAMNAELTKVIRESIEGQRVIKLFDGYDREIKRFSSINAKLRRLDMRATIADSALTPLAQFTIAISVGAVIAVALYQGNAQDLTVGSFGAFMAALGQIFDPIRRLTRVAGSMQRMLTAAESVFTLIDQLPESDLGAKAFPGQVQGRVEFNSVSHRFDDASKNTLTDISFVAEPGQTIALVGRSGSGKTTLVNMLPRFVMPDSGSITIDGYSIFDVNLKDLRSNISLVSQDVVLFEGSIAENVAYGVASEVSDEQILAALEAANLTGFVNSLPGGIHNQVGENANQLSGGQRQRLAIARALIKDAPILILDEATSALDNESERQVQASLERLMRGRTTLVIAHRLSTVKNADCILVMDEGRIIEQGSHDELLAREGSYAQLYRMQFERPEQAAGDKE